MDDICMFVGWSDLVRGGCACGEEAVANVKDIYGNDRRLCAEHARLMSESRQGKDLCVGDDDTCPEEIDWAMARPGVDGRCTRHAEEWEADQPLLHRLFLRFGR